MSIRRFERTCWRDIPSFALGISGPALDIAGEDGEPAWDAVVRIRAAMYFPNDDQKRKCYHQLVKTSVSAGARSETNRVLGRNDPMPLSAEEVQALVDAPSLSEIQEEIASVYEDGVIAGLVLRTILSCQKHHREYVGINNASRLISQMSRKWQRPTLSESNVKDRWGRFKSVAHLWATLISFRDRLTEDNVEEFLGVAEAFRREGVSLFVARSHRGPVLNPGETWRVCSGSAIQVFELSPPPLPKSSLRLLEPDALDAPLK